MDGLLLGIFAIGYLAIALERAIHIDKAASALLAGILCWTVLTLGSDDPATVLAPLAAHLGDIAGILFFLLGAMVIIELIDAHSGFQWVTRLIGQTSKRRLLWIVGAAAFCLSAVLDNLTTTIVLVSVLRKLLKNEQERLLHAGIVVIAANAGGAWTVIGDVTTTMLWIRGQITAGHIMASIGVPSLVCLATALACVSGRMRGRSDGAVAVEVPTSARERRHSVMVLALGMLALISVPVFKALTHLPPYMGMLAGLGMLWVVTDRLHRGKSDPERRTLSVSIALRKIDIATILFFLGILLCVASLDTAGILDRVGDWMRRHLADDRLVALAIGLLSSVVDNVPLVAAAQGMYGLTTHPTDHSFWVFLAYCAGTGGSILVIGSAAGVAAMGLERLSFWWYLRSLSGVALIAYLAGAVAFVLQQAAVACLFPGQ